MLEFSIKGLKGNFPINSCATCREIKKKKKREYYSIYLWYVYRMEYRGRYRLTRQQDVKYRQVVKVIDPAADVFRRGGKRTMHRFAMTRLVVSRHIRRQPICIHSCVHAFVSGERTRNAGFHTFSISK